MTSMKQNNKKRKPLRLEQRLKAIAKDESMQVELQTMQSQTDESLFVIDTHGDPKTKKQKVLTKKEKQKRQKKKEEEKNTTLRKIQKLIKTHGAQGVISLAAKKPTNKSTPRKPHFDLWDNTPTSKPRTLISTKVGMSMAGTAPVTLRPCNTLQNGVPIDTLPAKTVKFHRHAKTKARAAVAVAPALGGTSYCPDPEQHQDAVGVALAVEIRRNEAEEERKAPIAEGLSEDVKKVTVDDSDSESSDEEEEEEGEGMEVVTTDSLRRKTNEKLTRAQRNKQRRIKAELAALKARKNEKLFLHSLHRAKSLNKELTHLEKTQEEKRTTIKTLKDEQNAIPLGLDPFATASEAHPLQAPTVPVALTCELEDGKGGGLRRVRPKGSLMTDRILSMTERKMVNRKADTTSARKKRKIKSGKDHWIIVK